MTRKENLETEEHATALPAPVDTKPRKSVKADEPVRHSREERAFDPYDMPGMAVPVKEAEEIGKTEPEPVSPSSWKPEDRTAALRTRGGAEPEPDHAPPAGPSRLLTEPELALLNDQAATSYVAERVRHWQAVLGLGYWSFDVAAGPGLVLEGGTAGAEVRHSHYRHSTILIRTTRPTSGVWQFRTVDVDDMVLHELLHTLLLDLSHAGDAAVEVLPRRIGRMLQDRLDLHEERLIDWLAHLLLRMERGEAPGPFGTVMEAPGWVQVAATEAVAGGAAPDLGD